MDKPSEMLAGKIELNVEFVTDQQSRMNKWGWLREIVVNDISQVSATSSKGWAKIPLKSKEEAIRGQQSILSYVREHLGSAGWALQTSIAPAENGTFNLMIRKITLIVKKTTAA